MNKTRFVFVVMLTIMLFVGNAMADKTTSDADAVAGVDFTYAPQSTYNSYPEKRSLIGSYQPAHFPSSTFPTAPFSGKMEKWESCYEPALANTFKKLKWDKPGWMLFKKYDTDFYFSHPDLENEGTPNWVQEKPSGPNDVVYGEVVLRGGDLSPESKAKREAFQLLKYVTRANRYYVECRYIAKNKDRGLGASGGVTFSKAVGSAISPDDMQMGANGGLILGAQDHWQDTPVEVKIVSYNDPQPSNITEETKVDETQIKKTQTEDVKAEETKPATPSPPEYIAPFFFDFKKAEIREDQKANATLACERIARDKPIIKQNNLMVVIPGYCDKWGGEELNDTLCAERAWNVADLMQTECANFGIAEDEFSNLVYVYSAGNRDKNHRYPDDQLNRRVDVAYAKSITSVEKFPPNFIPNNKPETGGKKVGNK